MIAWPMLNLPTIEVCTIQLSIFLLKQSHSLFEVVYGFNLITQMDLMPIPIQERANVDGEKKAKMVKSMHKQVRKLTEAK